VSGATVINYKPEVLSVRDYYAYGGEINERTFEPIKPKYRYGFNNKENDNEIYGNGNAINFGDRIYNSRLGVWWGVDAKYYKYPMMSPYVFAGDNPIIFVDKDGRDIILCIKDSNNRYKYKKKYSPDMQPTTEEKVINEVIKALNEIYKVNTSESGVTPHDIIEKLANDKNIRLEIIVADHNFDPDLKRNTSFFHPINEKEGYIKLDPFLGLEFINKEDLLTEENRVSPTVILAHELRHAYDYFSNKEEYNKNTKKYPEGSEKEKYTSKEEEIAMGTEHDVAKARGEALRKYHNIEEKYKIKYDTKSSTTTEPKYERRNSSQSKQK
jgi:RHS repeat-associated protein